MERRAVLRTLGAAAAAVPGCAMLEGCGPGEDSVAAVRQRLEEATGTATAGGDWGSEAVRVKGSVREASQQAVLLDDGTGTARLVALGGFRTRNLDGGECVWATGVPALAADDPEADVLVVVDEAGLAE